MQRHNGQRIENDIENGIENNRYVKTGVDKWKWSNHKFSKIVRKFNVLFCTKCAISTEWSCNRNLS